MDNKGFAEDILMDLSTVFGTINKANVTTQLNFYEQRLIII